MDELKKYEERHRNWQHKSIEQLSTVNNFLLTISTGLLAFIFDKKVFCVNFFIWNSKIDWLSVIYFMSLFWLFLAIFMGVIVMITRLYDFRITRNITLVRQRFYKANSENNQNKLPHGDFEDPDFCQRIVLILKVIFCKITFFTNQESEMSHSKFDKEKFNTLRKYASELGFISWKWTKLQGLYFLGSVIFYFLYLLISTSMH